jgi:glycosyltransferase involved in cell wall biosynthesis
MGLPANHARNLRVIHVVLSLDPGGLERVVLSLARSARGFNQDVSVLCLERPGALAPQFDALGVKVTSLAKPPGVRWELVDQIRAVFRDTRPDVVHTHQISALLYAGRAARRERVAAVLHTRHLNYTEGRKTLPRRLRSLVLWRYASSYAHRFCCCSQDAVESAGAFRAIRRKNLFYVPNGIDTALFGAVGGHRAAAREQLGIPATSPVVGSVSRLAEVKQQDVLIRALARLRPEFPDARLLLVGDGPTRPRLEHLVAELGMADVVRFAGYQSNPERFLAAMDVFALPSRAEGMPLVVLEAWAAGLPVVATRVGGIPWMIEDGRTGYVVESGDVGGLAARLRPLLADPAKAREMGRAGQEVARAEYDVSVMAGSYDRHYRELLAAGRMGRAVAAAG